VTGGPNDAADDDGFAVDDVEDDDARDPGVADPGAADPDDDDNEEALLAAREHVGRLLALRAITTVIHVDDDHPASDQSESDPYEVIAALKDEVVTIEFLADNEATRDIVTSSNGELTSAQALAGRIELEPEGFTDLEMAALTDAARLAARSRAADAGDSPPGGAVGRIGDSGTPTEPADAESADAVGKIPEREATDIEAQTGLRQLIPHGVDYRPITLAQWNEEKEELLNPTVPVLILFDRDFHLEGESTDLGESLLAEVINRHDGNIYCGMLTHGAWSDAGERELVTRIADRSGSTVDVVDVVVIAKSAIVAKPGMFPMKLKAVLLARRVRALRTRVIGILSDAGQHAATELGKLDAYTMSELIVAADKEGTHGVHNMLRVAATKQRIAIHRALWPDEDVNSALGDIRLIHDAQREVNPLPATDISPLRREDRYDTGEYLADLHLALEPGDIFEKVTPDVVLNSAGQANPGKRFILLMQACDIAVRSDGHRLGSPKTFTLALVKRIRRDDRHSFDHFLEYYDEVGGDEVWCVRMSERVQFPVRALEACVFADDGQAVVKVGQQAPTTLTPGWRKRFDELQEWTGRTLASYKKMVGPGTDKAVARLLTESLTGTASELVDIKAKLDLNGDRVGYGLRRIGRASNDDARGILANAGNYTSRPGSEGVLFLAPKPGAAGASSAETSVAGPASP
jgi:hypothetical protein